MTAQGLYDKYVKTGHAEHTFEWKDTLKSVKTSLYRVRKTKNETFKLKEKDGMLILYSR